MTKSDITKYVAEKYGMSHEKAKEIINTVFDWIRDKVLAGSVVKIHYFGTFFPKILGRRSAHNPRTQEEVTAPASRSVSFHPSDRHARKKEEDELSED
jgi:nucleoid DNA-binding protein